MFKNYSFLTSVQVINQQRFESEIRTKSSRFRELKLIPLCSEVFNENHPNRIHMAGLGEQGVSSRCGLDTVHNIQNMF